MFKPTHSAGSGCGYVMIQGLLICGLLLINSILVKSMIGQAWFGEIRIGQALQFLLPILLIFAELWLYDFLFARYKRKRVAERQ